MVFDTKTLKILILLFGLERPTNDPESLQKYNVVTNHVNDLHSLSKTTKSMTKPETQFQSQTESIDVGEGYTSFRSPSQLVEQKVTPTATLPIPPPTTETATTTTTTTTPPPLPPRPQLPKTFQTPISIQPQPQTQPQTSTFNRSTNYVRYSNRFEAFPIHKKCFFIE